MAGIGKQSESLTLPSIEIESVELSNACCNDVSRWSTGLTQWSYARKTRQLSVMRARSVQIVLQERHRQLQIDALDLQVPGKDFEDVARTSRPVLEIVDLRFLLCTIVDHHLNKPIVT